MTDLIGQKLKEGIGATAPLPPINAPSLPAPSLGSVPSVVSPQAAPSIPQTNTQTPQDLLTPSAPFDNQTPAVLDELDKVGLPEEVNPLPEDILPVQPVTGEGTAIPNMEPPAGLQTANIVTPPLISEEAKRKAWEAAVGVGGLIGKVLLYTTNAGTRLADNVLNQKNIDAGKLFAGEEVPGGGGRVLYDANPLRKAGLLNQDLQLGPVTLRAPKKYSDLSLGQQGVLNFISAGAFDLSNLVSIPAKGLSLGAKALGAAASEQKLLRGAEATTKFIQAYDPAHIVGRGVVHGLGQTTTAIVKKVAPQFVEETAKALGKSSSPSVKALLKGGVEHLYDPERFSSRFVVAHDLLGAGLGKTRFGTALGRFGGVFTDPAARSLQRHLEYSAANVPDSLKLNTLLIQGQRDITHGTKAITDKLVAEVPGATVTEVTQAIQGVTDIALRQIDVMLDSKFLTTAAKEQEAAAMEVQLAALEKALPNLTREHLDEIADAVQPSIDKLKEATAEFLSPSPKQHLLGDLGFNLKDPVEPGVQQGAPQPVTERDLFKSSRNLIQKMKESGQKSRTPDEIREILKDARSRYPGVKQREADRVFAESLSRKNGTYKKKVIDPVQGPEVAPTPGIDAELIGPTVPPLTSRSVSSEVAAGGGTPKAGPSTKTRPVSGTVIGRVTPTRGAKPSPSEVQKIMQQQGKAMKTPTQEAADAALPLGQRQSDGSFKGVCNV
jgi:hypothetical protein